MSIIVENLTKVYGEQRAVDQISFEVSQGDVLGFLGPNGAGKSTTMRILSCYMNPTEGTAKVNGHDILDEPIKVKQQIGYLPENNPLYPDLYVREFLQLVAQLHGLGIQTKDRIKEMIGLTGLEKEQHKKIGQLSKGYRQRVGLAQAMLHDPQILILDEPTSGLDPNQLVEIRDLIRELGQKKTVIFSTHILQEVTAVCNRVVIIHNGKIVADDSLKNLQDSAGGKSVVEVEFTQEVEQAALEAIPGIDSVKKIDKFHWQLTAHTGENISEGIFSFAVEQKVTLVELKQQEQSLENIFSQLTQ